MAKTLTLRLLLKDDGTVVGLERTARAVDKVEKESDQAAGATRRFAAEQSRSTAAASGHASMLGRLTSVIGGLVGGAAMGLLIKRGYDYNQQLESSRISIAGLLSANRQYIGVQDQFAAALQESDVLLKSIEEQALKTKATVPQLADTFATTFGAVTSQGLKATNDEMLTMSTRLMQVGNAFGVIPEQMRQEINSLIGGMVTEDSIIARRLGLDNKSIKEMQRNGTFVQEILERTNAYAAAAEAQSNTLSGKIANTLEMVDRVVSQGLNGSFDKLKGLLDASMGWLIENGETVTARIQQVAGAVENVVVKVSDWVRENDRLVESIGATALIAGGAVIAISLIGATIAAITSPIFIGIAAIVAWGIAWENMSELSELEVNGKPIASYMRATWEAVTGIWATNLKAQAKLVEAMYHSVRAIIGSVMYLMIKPIRDVVNMVAMIPDGLAKIVPQGENAKRAAQALVGVFDKFHPGEHFTEARASMREAFTGIVDDARATGKAVAEAWNDESAIARPSEVLEGVYDRMKETMRGVIPELTKLGQDVMKAAIPQSTNTGGKRAAGEGGAKATKASSIGNMGDVWDASMGRMIRWYTEYQKLARETQEAIEDERIELIVDSGARELAERLEANDRWYVERRERIIAEHKGDAALLEKLDELKAEKDRIEIDRAKRNADEQERLRRESLAGTREWAKKMAAEIGTVGDQVTRVFGESKLELAGFFSGILDDMVDGQVDLAKSFDDLTKGLARSWTRMLGDMLTKTIVNGDSMISQLRGLWDKLGGAGAQGGVGGAFDAGVMGAGMGGMVGSIFQTENNYAGTGGMVGGAVGAALGAAIAGYFTGGMGAGAGAKIGMMIGTAIGTAIGSVVTKGTDHIKVAISNGVATITEKGISAETRHELETQVNRRIKEEGKAWRSILDLFPESVQEQLDKLNGDPMKRLSLFGGSGTIESADITDQGALNALGDFLGNELPEAVFEVYGNSLRIALDTMGVEQGKIAEIFKYWGTLQGKELQEAVRYYVTTLVEATDLRDLMAAPFEDRLAEARRRAGATSLSRMDDLDAQIATTVASASTLTDIEDIVAAQDRVNQMMRQRYEMEIAYLARIDAVQKQITDSIASQREQIEMAGMDDQQKIDHIYGRMGQLRSQLEVAQDPEEIQRLTQQIQQYVSQALGIAPDNEENRAKLLGILGDIEGLSTTGLNAARAAVEAREQKALDLQQQMLEALIGIKDVLGEDEGDDDEGDGKKDGTTGSKEGKGAKNRDVGNNSWQNVESTAAVLTQQQSAIDATIAAMTRFAAESTPKEADITRMLETWKTQAEKTMSADAIAKAVARALENVEIGVAVTGTDGLINATATATTRRIRRNPDSIVPRGQ